ncbi:F-box/FBD/LRR-repeat protein [Raphanus sativus]|uniref:F-box/FBD/LRR-repeat protein At3g51530 n=1 Tax=Raphanus sativus TaxID=3726 RepID=A0A6J0JC73_RAPSA|nr:F-box/FBD/LRR-repeat protein At3g51530 [Raphanus sativus]XP_056845766.1 F-box/FBD/LRR-repeat protein At3g51530-like [Raphanus sativus]XP_056845767.1 F-box/FBD/LRR-repeat protein At3g51530-like [Raphanus sativus]KAJ4868292.1 F-box/FBD/LRR-repeat protein [Raphanus sativus]
MEQCGESLRKRDVVDRISALPEPLILQILSLLPTKLVIATSVLSKRWRCVWKMVPVLRFESKGDIKKFAESVSKSLLSHKSPILNTLHLKLNDRCDDVYIGVWAGIAITRHVRDLELDLHFGYSDPPIRFPSSLFCFDTLETLKFKHHVLLDIPSLVSLNSLRTLHLHSVVYKDSESIRNLFSSCPNLEHLVVHRSYNDVVKFVIESPSLKTLSLYGENFVGRENGIGGYVINAPSLVRLNIQMLKGYEHCLIENAPELLIEANVSNVSNITNETIMASLKSTKRLCLDLSPLQIAYPTGIVFYQLVYLEMYSHKVEWWNLLAVMLDSSPKLQVLKLTDDSSQQPKLVSDKKNMEPGKWNQPKCVPQCLLWHLETFVWTRPDWIREEEKEVARYILGNARHLKKATFIIEPIESKRLFRLAKRREMLNELPAVVRASSSCQLVFQSE